VLRLQGLGLYDLKPDQCVASDQIDSYLEPDGRSGITSPSKSHVLKMTYGQSIIIASSVAYANSTDRCNSKKHG
jgi:hypothetical protein